MIYIPKVKRICGVLKWKIYGTDKFGQEVDELKEEVEIGVC